MPAGGPYRLCAAPKRLESAFRRSAQGQHPLISTSSKELRNGPRETRAMRALHPSMRTRYHRVNRNGDQRLAQTSLAFRSSATAVLIQHSTVGDAKQGGYNC